VKINASESNSPKMSIDENELEDEYHRYGNHWMRRLIDRKQFADDSTDDEDDEDEEVKLDELTINRAHFFIGKDYSNYYKKDFESVEKFDEGLTFLLFRPIILVFFL